MFLLSNIAINAMLYIIGFLLISFGVFHLLRATRFEELFKQGKVKQIRIAYFIAAAIISYLILEIIIKIFNYLGNIY